MRKRAAVTAITNRLLISHFIIWPLASSACTRLKLSFMPTRAIVAARDRASVALTILLNAIYDLRQVGDKSGGSVLLKTLIYNQNI